MAASHELQITVPAPPAQVWDQAQRVVYALSGAQPVPVGPGMMRASVGASLWSWGEDVTLRFATGPAGTSVHIRSECKFPLQLIDWGRNKKNVEHIAHGLSVHAQQGG